MTQLKSKIEIYLNKQYLDNEVILQNDGNGDYIKEWNLNIAQPTEAQLNALEAQANELERLNLVKANRANEYPDFKEYLDGIVKGDDAQIQKYINDCLAVKAKYPKE
jgi:hypothetical protein